MTGWGWWKARMLLINIRDGMLGRDGCHTAAAYYTVSLSHRDVQMSLFGSLFFQKASLRFTVFAEL